MLEQGEHLDTEISLADLAYLTGNAAVLSELFSLSPLQQNWVFPEKILNHNNYTQYKGRFFNKPAEQYLSYQNLIQTRQSIETNYGYECEDSYFGGYEDYLSEEDFWDPSFNDDSSYSLWQLADLNFPYPHNDAQNRDFFSIKNPREWGF